MIRPKIKPQYPLEKAALQYLLAAPNPAMREMAGGLLAPDAINPDMPLPQNASLNNNALLAPDLAQIGKANAAEGYYEPDQDQDDSAFLAATQVGKDKGVPAAYILEMIKKMSWHESRDNPLRRQDVKDPVDDKVKPIGKGRGALQFEGYYEQLGENKEEMSFKDAVDRARNYYTDKLKKPIPPWLKEIKEGYDARSLTKKQQYALAIYNLRMKSGADISKVYKGEQTLSDFWENSHWAGKGRSGNPNASKEDRAIAKNRREAFARSMDIYKTDLNAAWN